MTVAWIALVLAFVAAGLAGVALGLALDARARAKATALRLEEMLVSLAMADSPGPAESAESTDDPLSGMLKISDAYRKRVR